MKAETPELVGETEILRDANIALTEDLSLERVAETLLDFLGQLIPYDSANVMLLEGNSQFIVTAFRRYETFEGGEASRFIALDLNTNPILQRICSTKQSVVVSDTHKDPGWQWVQRCRTRSQLDWSAAGSSRQSHWSLFS
jgi:transcriptional regulator with GAF, ATPase, and Fis domain